MISLAILEVNKFFHIYVFKIMTHFPIITGNDIFM